MNIHEHQAKKILKEYGAVVPEGIFAFTVDELIEEIHVDLKGGFKEGFFKEVYNRS